MTPRTRLKAAALQRIKKIKEERPQADIQEEWLDDRAILLVIEGHRAVECDFVESTSSCSKTRRTAEYYDILGQGIKLGIIVPQKEVRGEMSRLRMVKDHSRFVLLGYDENGIEAASI